MIFLLILWEEPEEFGPHTDEAGLALHLAALASSVASNRDVQLPPPVARPVSLAVVNAPNSQPSRLQSPTSLSTHRGSASAESK